MELGDVPGHAALSRAVARLGLADPAPAFRRGDGTSSREIEPPADLFIQDQLRGSPLLLFARGWIALTRDANRAAGVQHRLLGREIGVGFTALNPGWRAGRWYASPT